MFQTKFSREIQCSDNQKIKKEMFKNKKQENITLWLMEYAREWKRCDVSLNTSSGKIYHLKDTVISLQGVKIQSEEQLPTSSGSSRKGYDAIIFGQSTYGKLCTIRKSSLS